MATFWNFVFAALCIVFAIKVIDTTPVHKEPKRQFSTNIGDTNTDAPIIDGNCERQTYCEGPSVRNYPNHVTQTVLRNVSNPELIARDLELDNDKPYQKSYFTKNNEIPLCNTVEKIIYPRAALDLKNKWHFILNEEDFKQAIHVKICTDSEKPCKVIRPSKGYTSVCKQEYSYQKLVSLKDNKLVLVTNLFPDGCSCSIKFNTDPTGNLKIYKNHLNAKV